MPWHVRYKPHHLGLPFKPRIQVFLITSKRSLEARIININMWPKELLGIRYYGGMSTHDHSGLKHRPLSELIRHVQQDEKTAPY